MRKEPEGHTGGPCKPCQRPHVGWRVKDSIAVGKWAAPEQVQDFAQQFGCCRAGVGAEPSPKTRKVLRPRRKGRRPEMRLSEEAKERH